METYRKAARAPAALSGGGGGWTDLLARRARRVNLRARRLFARDGGVAVFFVGPALALMLLLNAYPMLYALYYSLHDYNLKRPKVMPFVGLENYARFFSSATFTVSLQRTLTFSLLSVLLVTLLGLLFALVLHTGFRGHQWVLAILLIPWAIPNVAAGTTWRWIYNSNYGALNGLLYSLGLIDKYHVILGSPALALYLLVNAFVWKETPLATVLFLTSLKAIPDELYKAAMVDGAGPVRRFLFITLPWAKTALLLVLVYTTILAIRTFDLVFILTGGGPGDATSVIAWSTYTETFRNLEFGYGSAISYLIAVTTFLLATWYIKLLYRPAGA